MRKPADRCPWLAFVLALWFCASSLEASDWTYTLRPGDDLWSVAQLHCGSAKLAEQLARHNAISDPARLRAGQRLRIPVAWLVRKPVDVALIAVRGTVTDAGGRARSVGERLTMGERIVTAGDSFAVVRFADGTELEVGPQSELLFNVLTAFGDSGMVDSHLRLYRGGGNARVIKQGTASSFRVWTPTGIAAVRGTSFRLKVEEANAEAASRLETLTGAVAYEQEAAQTEVPGGTGLIASSAGVLKETLLPAPILTAPGASLSAADVLRWQAVAGASGYQFDVYSLAGAVPLQLSSARLDASSYPLSTLAPGNYRIAVRGIAASGLEGLDAELAFALQASPPEPLPVTEKGGQTALRWKTPAQAFERYTVEMERIGADSEPERYQVVDPSLPIAGTMAARPGRYRWRVQGDEGVFSEPAMLLIEPARPSEMTVEAGAWNEGRPVTVRWDGDSNVAYRVELTDASGIRAVKTIDAGAPKSYRSERLATGVYQVSVVPKAGELEGPALTAEFTVADDQPWWKPALFFLPLLFL